MNKFRYTVRREPDGIINKYSVKLYEFDNSAYSIAGTFTATKLGARIWAKSKARKNLRRWKSDDYDDIEFEV